MSVFDIFNNDAFKQTELIAAIEDTEYQPMGLGAMNIFTKRPVRTDSVWIEKNATSLSLIQTSQRGSPLEQATRAKRDVRNFPTLRLAKSDRILASELAFVRQFGMEQAVETLQQEIAIRMYQPGGLISDMELTMERQRLGAIQGKVLDADGTVINNWFTEMGITEVAEIAMNLAAMAEGDLKAFSTALIRSIARTSNGVWTDATRIHAMCGDDMYDELCQLPEVRKKYENRNDAYVVPGSGAFESFEYGGIVWQNYRGTDDNLTTSVAIGVDDAKFFPVNAPGAFLEVCSPGEQFADLGMLGQDLYPMIVRDQLRDQYVDLEIYKYPLLVMTRPQMLRTARRGA